MLKLQCPGPPPQNLLLDELENIFRAKPVVECLAFFGFATGAGLEALLAIEQVRALFEQGIVQIMVGLDAVTDEHALKVLMDMCQANNKVQAHVVRSTTGDLIHPKMWILRFDTGDGVRIVGSNNLTIQGLSRNVEAYEVVFYSSQEWDEIRTGWERFKNSLATAGAEVRTFDSTAFAWAAQNQRNNLGKRKRIARTLRRNPRPSPTVGVGIPEPVLVAAIPRAGVRWPQVHLQRKILEDFLGDDISTFRHLELREAGTHKLEKRVIVHSETNRNVRIEVGAARRYGSYPKENYPIVLFRREGAVRLSYVFVYPDTSIYEQLKAFLESRYNGRKNQYPRIIASLPELMSVWPEIPLVD